MLEFCIKGKSKLQKRVRNVLLNMKSKQDSQPENCAGTDKKEHDKSGSDTEDPAQSKKRLFRNRSNSFQTDIFEGRRIKITVMGDTGVGKSCIISRFLNNEFTRKHLMTVEDLHRGIFEVKNDRLAMDILDTSGAYSFPAMRKLAIETSDGFILVYSVDNIASFETVREIRDEILATRGDRTSPIVIVANKTDLPEVERKTESRIIEIVSECIEWGNGYVESSALENKNITRIFEEVLLQSKFQYALREAVDQKQHLTELNSKHKKRSCIVS